MSYYKDRVDSYEKDLLAAINTAKTQKEKWENNAKKFENINGKLVRSEEILMRKIENMLKCFKHQYKKYDQVKNSPEKLELFLTELESNRNKIRMLQKEWVILNQVNQKLKGSYGQIEKLLLDAPKVHENEAPNSTISDIDRDSKSSVTIQTDERINTSLSSRNALLASPTRKYKNTHTKSQKNYKQGKRGSKNKKLTSEVVKPHQQGVNLSQKKHHDGDKENKRKKKMTHKNKSDIETMDVETSPTSSKSFIDSSSSEKSPRRVQRGHDSDSTESNRNKYAEENYKLDIGERKNKPKSGSKKAESTDDMTGNNKNKSGHVDMAHLICKQCGWYKILLKCPICCCKKFMCETCDAHCGCAYTHWTCP